MENLSTKSYDKFIKARIVRRPSVTTSLAIIWALAPTVFWPMNHDLYYGAIGKISKTDTELV